MSSLSSVKIIEGVEPNMTTIDWNSADTELEYHLISQMKRLTCRNCKKAVSFRLEVLRFKKQKWNEQQVKSC